eukprot:TRINITY_DN206_c0_g1_i1.p1 TRINITY_DN206_c0_g1~~TRINITY_DN206_c0_g1_i1.p1  ORF type:complete len:232 (+),score=81.23 TRINITY_DN206_c0_g1_i1:678-1373(+)
MFVCQHQRKEVLKIKQKKEKVGSGSPQNQQTVFITASVTHSPSSLSFVPYSLPNSALKRDYAAFSLSSVNSASSSLTSSAAHSLSSSPSPSPASPSSSCPFSSCSPLHYSSPVQSSTPTSSTSSTSSTLTVANSSAFSSLTFAAAEAMKDPLSTLLSSLASSKDGAIVPSCPNSNSNSNSNVSSLSTPPCSPLRESEASHSSVVNGNENDSCEFLLPHEKRNRKSGMNVTQ